MSTDIASKPEQKDNSATVQLFQKAHAKMIAIQRLDEQFNQMVAQRRKLQEELRGIQREINGEFERCIESTDESPARVFSQLASDSKRAGRLPLRMETPEPVGQ